MAMTAGNVSVDDDGTETFTPNDGTNAAKMYYQAILAVNSTAKMKSKTGGGPATFTPPKPPVVDPLHPTPAEQAAMQAWAAAGPVMTPPPPPTTSTVVHAITPDPSTKQKTAELANALALIVPYIQANAQAKIANNASADGLMKDSGGGACQHPATNKFIPIV